MQKVFNFDQQETEHINSKVKALEELPQKEAIAILQAFENYRSTLHIIRTKQFFPEEMPAVSQIIDFQEMMLERIYLDIRAKYELDSLVKEKAPVQVVDHQRLTKAKE